MFAYIIHNYVAVKNDKNLIGVNITALERKLTLYRFSLKMSRFSLVFRAGKMRSMRSVQRQVEFRRLGNKLPVLGNANSLCKIVNMLCFVAAT